MCEFPFASSCNSRQLSSLARFMKLQPSKRIFGLRRNGFTSLIHYVGLRCKMYGEVIHWSTCVNPMPVYRQLDTIGPLKHHILIDDSDPLLHSFKGIVIIQFNIC